MQSIIQKITNYKTIILFAFAGTLLVIASNGCATAHGFGKDMEGAGKDIQNETK